MFVPKNIIRTDFCTSPRLLQAVCRPKSCGHAKFDAPIFRPPSGGRPENGRRDYWSRLPRAAVTLFRCPGLSIFRPDGAWGEALSGIPASRPTL